MLSIIKLYFNKYFVRLFIFVSITLFFYTQERNTMTFTFHRRQTQSIYLQNDGWNITSQLLGNFQNEGHLAISHLGILGLKLEFCTNTIKNYFSRKRLIFINVLCSLEFVLNYDIKSSNYRLLIGTPERSIWWVTRHSIQYFLCRVISKTILCILHFIAFFKLLKFKCIDMKFW